MNTYPSDIERYTQPTIIVTEALVQGGFTPEEITDMLRLRDWYQNGGSDRVEVVRHLEFLKFLIKTGKLP